jgi:ubiquinone/menaquinone biosynthesis C-methylase UbiE
MIGHFDAGGLDLTDSRVLGARRLTERVGLSGLVEFVQGDATRMPFPMSNFDALVSQEVWCHIPEKDALLAECARVLKPTGKIAFTDIMIVGEFSSADEPPFPKSTIADVRSLRTH